MLNAPEYFVNLYAQQLHTRHDHIDGIGPRIDRAADILRTNGIDVDDGKFYALSSKNDGTGYHVTATDCECADHANGAPFIGQRKFCKHRLAVAMLRRYIAEQISPRVLDGLDDAANRNALKWQKNGTATPICHLARHGEQGDRLTDGKYFDIQIVWSRKLDCWTPRSDADYLAAAHWLEHVAQPIPYHQRQWMDDPEAVDAMFLPFQDWQQVYGHLYRNAYAH